MVNNDIQSLPSFLLPPKTFAESKLGSGLRENKGKIRFDLMEPFAIEQLAMVFTKGAEKYEDNNWLRGMKWSKMMASLERHYADFKKGKDFDFDADCKECKEGKCKNHTGLYHIAQVAWNALGILSYYKWFPQGDDRLHHILPKPKIGLDIDEVICNWVPAWCKLYNMKEPTAWYFDGNILDKFEKMREDGILDDFYANLEPRIDPSEIHFEPHCYVTSRPVDSLITIEWLRKNGFPMRPVYTVSAGESKVETIKQAGVDIFVDDRYDNYEELNRNGICCFLMDAAHNQRYSVGYRRIKSLKELQL